MFTTTFCTVEQADTKEANTSLQVYILSSVHVIKIQQYWQHDYYERGDQVLNS